MEIHTLGSGIVHSVIPGTDSADWAAAYETQLNRPQPASEHTLFIVDDEAMVRRGLREVIEFEPGLRCLGDAGEARLAIERILTLRPDVVILDLGLKRGHGIEVIRELRQRVSDVGILVFSMHDDGATVEAALRAGANGYLCKSDGISRLSEAIRNVAVGRSFISEQADMALKERPSLASDPRFKVPPAIG